MDTEVTLSVQAIILVVGAIASPLCGVIIFLFKFYESRRKEDKTEMINLTKSFTESMMSHKQVLENNTSALNEVRTVIKELPEQIMLHNAASQKG